MRGTRLTCKKASVMALRAPFLTELSLSEMDFAISFRQAAGVWRTVIPWFRIIQPSSSKHSVLSLEFLCLIPSIK